MKKLLLVLLFTAPGWHLFAQLSSNEIAKLYFIEAEKRFNQNEFATAMEYIDKTEQELGETNGRILNLKVKTLYNSGDFRGAQRALDQFINQYASTVTAEIKDETMAYYIKLERYFEKKVETENARADALRRKYESLKHFGYVTCRNSYCSSGYYSEQYMEQCYNCDGTGRVTEYDYAQSFLNGLNGTNNPTSYKVTCKSCNGYGKTRQTRSVACKTCKGAGKVLGYHGSESYSSDEISSIISAYRKDIDYYINLRKEIAGKASQTIFPIKKVSSDLLGLCDRNLKLVVPYRYDKAEVISKDLAIVTSNSLSGVINSKNELVLPMEHKWIVKAADNALLIEKSSKQYLTDFNGTPKGPAVESYKSYGKHLVVFKKNSLYGVMNYDGSIITEAQYLDAIVFEWNPFLVAFKQTNNKWKLLTLTTTVRDQFQEEFASIKSHIHDKKKVLLLNNSLTKIAKTNGVLVSQDSFNEVKYYEKLGMLSLKKGSLYGVYDIGKESYVAPKYESVSFYDPCPHRVIVSQHGSYGVIDSNGRPIIPVEKVKIWFYTDKDQFIVQEKANSKKRFVYDTNGNFAFDYKDN